MQSHYRHPLPQALTALCLIVILLFVSACASSQQVVNSTGKTVSDGSTTIEYSIGEVSITTVTSAANTNYITQGLLQPTIKIINPGCEIINDTVNWFPNPAEDILRVVSRVDWITDYRIYAADGKLVRISPFTNNQINLRNLPGGVYFIKLYPGCNDKFRTLKVVKQ
jgi:hypothetical protein